LRKARRTLLESDRQAEIERTGRRPATVDFADECDVLTGSRWFSRVGSLVGVVRRNDSSLQSIKFL